VLRASRTARGPEGRQVTWRRVAGEGGGPQMASMPATAKCGQGAAGQTEASCPALTVGWWPAAPAAARAGGPLLAPPPPPTCGPAPAGRTVGGCGSLSQLTLVEGALAGCLSVPLSSSPRGLWRNTHVVPTCIWERDSNGAWREPPCSLRQQSRSAPGGQPAWEAHVQHARLRCVGGAAVGLPRASQLSLYRSLADGTACAVT
jgi:hypothetical protein